MPWPIKHPQSYSTAICVAFGADGLMPIPGAGGYDVFYAIKPLQRTVDVGYVRDNTTVSPHIDFFQNFVGLETIFLAATTA